MSRSVTADDKDLVGIKIQYRGWRLSIQYMYLDGTDLTVAVQAINCPEEEFVKLAHVIANAGVIPGLKGLPVIEDYKLPEHKEGV